MAIYEAVRVHAKEDKEYHSYFGGNALIPKTVEVTRCKVCGRELLLFFQIELSNDQSLHFQNGSRLVVFMCPECNEIPTFDNVDGILPSEYWNLNEGHFYIALFKPEFEEVRTVRQQPLLKYFGMELMELKGSVFPTENIRIGGEPYWLQDSHSFQCSCGASMEMICQIPENYPFPKQENAPEQPDTFSEDDYCLFLGNEVYIFGCTKQCHHQAVWVTVQN